MRAYRRFLNLNLPTPVLSDDDRVPLERVSFAPLARRQLREQLDLPGRLRGGLLFGTQQGSTLHIELATPMGLPWWYHRDQASPLQINERYILGWSDCMQGLHGGRVDWRGNWLAYPDSQLGEMATDLPWLRQGAEVGLFDDRHCLLTVGWETGLMVGRAYISDFGETTELECGLGISAEKDRDGMHEEPDGPGRQ